MSVPVSKRKKSQFEALTRMFRLRKSLTELLICDFGFSKEKSEKSIERFVTYRAGTENIEKITEIWRNKVEKFEEWFLEDERKTIMTLLREIEAEFTQGNSIYPSDTTARTIELCERRKHFNNAIALCYVLRSELNYIVSVYPSDLNKFAPFVTDLDEQIALFKGVRKADNKFFKAKA